MMLSIAKNALNSIQYQKRPGSNLFDELHEFEGWNFLAEQIFQLPRSTMYLNAIGKRKLLAEQSYEMHERREKEKKAMLKSRMSTYSLNVKGSPSKKGNISQHPSSIGFKSGISSLNVAS